MRSLVPTSVHEARSLYRIIASSVIFLLLYTSGKTQSVWTWKSGDNTSNQAGVYGTKGVAAAGNVPSSRDSYSTWTDASGNFWFFGGIIGANNSYNDLWKYNPGTGQWTWVSGDNTINKSGVYGTKGTAAAANKPGARFGQIAWTDASGNFWIFGGKGYDGSGNSGYLNDLWKFDPTTGQWTWVSGNNTRNATGTYGAKGTAAAANKPGARYYQAGWRDGSGNFWIYGGSGYDGNITVGYLNDLWKYNPTTGQWTWVSGDNTINKSGVYGTKGTAAAANKPGGRNSHSGWNDASGNIWIWGGSGYDGTGTGNLNDLWKYNIGTGQWTWVSGNNSRNTTGTYGTMGTAAVANMPGGRYGQTAIPDGSGNMWLFGGYGYDGTGNIGLLNDLWGYNFTSGQWTWKSGDTTRNSAAVYGTKGTGAATNKPGGRVWVSGWLDAAGNFWLFGGYDISGNNNYNDLWEFNALTVLPIREISLTGKHRDNGNLLTWQTVGEENTAKFSVERSANGIDFTAIGALAAIGSGNNHYTFTDYSAPGNKVYYRVQIQDLNGFAYYSNITSITNSDATRISVYPNPVVNNVTLLTSDNNLLNTQAKIYDAAGRLVSVVTINNQQQTIDLHNLPKGVLLLHLSNGSTFTIIKK